MSSMRNAVQRRNHKERAQPIEREKWGLLEKAKDYKLRAANHREKKQKLKLLRQKVIEKNPDEFSFAMMSSKVDKEGRKVADRGNKPLSQDVVKLLKTQDAAYIRTMLQMCRKEREDLEEMIMVEKEGIKALGGDGEARKLHKTVFVGDREEQRKFKADEWFGEGGEWPKKDKKKEIVAKERDEDEDDVEEAPPKKLSKKQQEAKLLAEKEQKALLRRRERAKERMAIHLEAVKARERDLTIAEEELEKQRAKMNNSIGGINKHGVKFKIRERKR